MSRAALASRAVALIACLVGAATAVAALRPASSPPPPAAARIVLEVGARDVGGAEAATGPGGAYVAVRHPAAGQIRVQRVGSQGAVSMLPALPAERSDGELVALAVWRKRPCVATRTGDRPTVACFAEERWEYLALPEQLVDWRVVQLATVEKTLYAVAVNRGASRDIVVLRVNAAGKWTALPGLPSLGPDRVVHLGRSLVGEAGSVVLGVVGGGLRAVFALTADRWKAIAKPTPFRGLANQNSGPVRTAYGVLLSRTVLRGTKWPLFIDRAKEGGRLVASTSGPLNRRASAAQGRLLAVAGSPWIVWQEAISMGRPTERTTVYASRLDAKGHPSRRFTIGSFASKGPAQLGLLRLGSSIFVLTTRPATAAGRQSTKVLLSRLQRR